MLEDWTVWEIVAYIDGRNEAYANEDKPEAMSGNEFDALLSVHNILHSVN
ncbi:hypothetical protein [uncultured Bradyrhizobium sp.]